MTEAPPQENPTLLDLWDGLLGWCRRRPLDAILLAMILSVIVYYFGLFRVFHNGLESTARWAWTTWNAENDLEHGPLIVPAALFIVWYHRAALLAAPKSGSLAGLAIAFVGILLFVFSVRTLQPRIAIVSLPVLLYGGVRFLWGRETARLVLFPCVFLLFMIPVGFIVSRTVALQTLTASVAAKLSGLLGIAVDADGDTLRALDGAFQFKVAGGCSGVRSLTAMTMLAALYVHFTQPSLAKQVIVFCSSLIFALLGNFMRIFTVVLFAHYVSPKIAGTLYHDYSGFIFFPVAVGAMAGFSALVNRDWAALLRPPAAPALPELRKPEPAPAPSSAVAAKPATPISYDY